MQSAQRSRDTGRAILSNYGFGGCTLGLVSELIKGALSPLNCLWSRCGGLFMIHRIMATILRWFVICNRALLILFQRLWMLHFACFLALSILENTTTKLHSLGVFMKHHTKATIPYWFVVERYSFYFSDTGESDCFEVNFTTAVLLHIVNFEILKQLIYSDFSVL